MYNSKFTPASQVAVAYWHLARFDFRWWRSQASTIRSTSSAYFLVD